MSTKVVALPRAEGSPADAIGREGAPARRLVPDTSGVTTRFLLSWMFGFLKPVKPLVFLACFYLSAAVGIEVFTASRLGAATSYIQRLHFDAGAVSFWSWFTSRDVQSAGLRRLMLALLGLISLTLVLRYLREVANAKLSMRMVYYIREAVYDKLQRVGFGYHDALSSGQLINRALSDLQNVRQFLQTAVLSTLEIVLIVGGYILLLLTVSKWVALLSLVPLPIWTWYILRFSQRVQPAAKAVMEAEDRNVSILTENIAGVHVVKAFATEEQEVAKYGANCDTFLSRVQARIRLFADFTPVIRSIAMASHLSLFFVAGVLIIKSRLAAGDFLILGQAMSGILSRLQQVSTINEQYQNAVVSARRLYEVLLAPATVPERPGAIPLRPGPGAVRFENVTFGYDPDKPVLRQVSFAARGGSIVAIVGPTGAGKSTLVNLVARFYDPQEGSVSIDGMDVSAATLNSLRTQVSFVFQETYLFSDTVAGNIAYGRPGISEGDIEAAARLAQAQEFIEDLPLRYDTMLGERGASLSGGQKQRLAIARAILTNPRILILDDATASVDPETEDLIRRGMRFVMQGRTTFIIAHRISTVKQADLVLVLEEGRITQAGTHAELMQQTGHYREIAFAQLAGDDDAASDDSPSHMDRVASGRAAGAAPVETVHGAEEKLT